LISKEGGVVVRVDSRLVLRKVHPLS